MSDTMQGVMITVVGMGLVFLSLGIVLLTMILLQKVFPQKAAADADEPAPQAEGCEPPAAALTSEKAAAIGVALAYALAEEQAGSAPAGPSAWARLGRSRQLNQPLAREKRR